MKLKSKRVLNTICGLYYEYVGGDATGFKRFNAQVAAIQTEHGDDVDELIADGFLKKKTGKAEKIGITANGWRAWAGRKFLPILDRLKKTDPEVAKELIQMLKANPKQRIKEVKLALENAGFRVGLRFVRNQSNGRRILFLLTHYNYVNGVPGVTIPHVVDAYRNYKVPQLHSEKK